MDEILTAELVGGSRLSPGALKPATHLTARIPRASATTPKAVTLKFHIASCIGQLISLGEYKSDVPSILYWRICTRNADCKALAEVRSSSAQESSKRVSQRPTVLLTGNVIQGAIKERSMKGTQTQPLRTGLLICRSKAFSGANQQSSAKQCLDSSETTTGIAKQSALQLKAKENGQQGLAGRSIRHWRRRGWCMGSWLTRSCFMNVSWLPSWLPGFIRRRCELTTDEDFRCEAWAAAGASLFTKAGVLYRGPLARCSS